MHPLHDYIARQVSDRLKDHRMVVVYDPRSELPIFFEESCGGGRIGGGQYAGGLSRLDH